MSCRPLLTLVAGLAVAVPAAAQTCRSYQLVDNDTGERVEGCVPLAVTSSLATPLQVVPALHERVRFGWKIATLTRGDLLARMGLRPGDVLLQINGHDLAARAEPTVIAEVLAGSEALVVTVGSTPRRAAAPQAVQVMEVSRTGSGFKLDSVPQDSFFATIGLQPGDTVLSIAGQKVTDMASLLRIEKDAEAMPEVLVRIRRDGKELDLLVKAQ